MRWLIAAMLLMAVMAPLAAQPPDSTLADSAAVADTAVDVSAMFLKTYEANRVRVPVLPLLGRRDLLPALSRMVFDRDSIEWHNAETLSDLLSKVPGVFVWRGGWIGRPEPIMYQGRGAGGTEFLVDGVPWIPLGVDSISVDPSLMPLSFYDRVEVERLPGLLRVHLFTRRHDRLPPRTKVAVSSGDLDIARYIVSLERRSAGGVGFVLAADHLAIPFRTQPTASYSNTQGWLQLSYVPKNGRLAAAAQLMRSGPNRGTIRTTATPADTLSQGLDAGRTDLQASLTLLPGPGGTGFSASLQAARSSWTEDSSLVTLGGPDRHVRYVDQSLWQFGGRVGHRTPITAIDAEAWHRTRWTPLDARGSIGLAPIPAVALSAEGVYQKHDGDRTARNLTGRASLVLPLRFKVAAVGRTGTVLPHPARRSATPQSVTDFGVLGGFDHPRLAVEAGLWQTGGFVPERFPLYRTIDSLVPVGETKWLTVNARLALRQWFIVDGWYSNPISATKPEGLPPTHSIVSATIQSKFLRTFRSGIFGLKLQGSMETWGNGTIGRDSKGALIPLRGATFFRGLLQIRLGDFIAYYDRVNFQATRLTYLPGLPIQRFGSTFGVRWEFTN